jgi:hypothetical protein
MAAEGESDTDKYTLCLWHFDEEPEAKRYKDNSGNDYHLWRSGIRAADPFVVQLKGKFSTT